MIISIFVPLATSFSAVNIQPLFLTQNMTTESSAHVFIDPQNIVKDYLLDPGYQIGDKFTVHVNVSAVTDLFSWQINLTWNKAVLNITRIIQGEFLARSLEQTSSEALGIVMNATEYGNGRSAFVESILGNVTGITGSGRLVSIEFLVLAYGYTDLTISLTGNLATTLLDSNGNTITFTKTDGYFRNYLKGDANGDGAVDIFDIGTVSAHWYPGPPIGPLGYGKEADINMDGSVDIFDIALVSANWGRSR